MLDDVGLISSIIVYDEYLEMIDEDLSFKQNKAMTLIKTFCKRVFKENDYQDEEVICNLSTRDKRFNSSYLPNKYTNINKLKKVITLGDTILMKGTIKHQIPDSAYLLEGGTLKVSKLHKTVKLIISSIRVDEFGWPIIPDIVEFREALKNSLVYHTDVALLRRNLINGDLYRESSRMAAESFLTLKSILALRDIEPGILDELLAYKNDTD